MERNFFPSFDGKQISLLLERPAGAEARLCVVFLHGGAWRFGLADSYWPRRAAPCIIASAIAPPLCAI